jgi:four helix bundle protein
VFQRSHGLVVELYRLTAELPERARAVLGDELRRAGTAIAAHIAAASRCRRPRDYAAGLNHAEAALARTEYLLLLGLDTGQLAAEITSALLSELDAIDRALAVMRDRLSVAITAPHVSGVVRAPMV